MRFVVACALAVASLAAAVSALAQEPFAQAEIGGFELSAETEIDLDNGDPYIRNIACYASSEDISFSVGRDGQITWLRLSFNGEPDEDGNRSSLALLGDGIWLYIDGRRYEYRNIPTPSRRFANYEYPPDPNASGIMLPVWRGYAGVRQQDTDPFMHMSRIYGELIAAERLEWGFKSRNWEHVDRNVAENRLPEGWETQRYPIQRAGLFEALEWCTRQVASEAATHLPAEYR